MKRRISTFLLASVLFALVGTGVLWAEMLGFGAKGAANDPVPTLQDMLTYALQDEYLARAEYEAIMEKWGAIRPFTNIVQAEVRHAEWLEGLFEDHGFVIPENTAAMHVVMPSDLKGAFETGVQAEIENIAMYDKFLALELPDDVQEVFERLRAGSVNHLRAFRTGLSRCR